MRNAPAWPLERITAKVEPTCTDRLSASVDSLSVQVGSTLAVIRSSGQAGALRIVTFDLVDWATTEVRTQRLTQLYIPTTAALPSAVVHGASIAIGQLLFRYD